MASSSHNLRISVCEYDFEEKKIKLKQLLERSNGVKRNRGQAGRDITVPNTNWLQSNLFIFSLKKQNKNPKTQTKLKNKGLYP